MKQVLIVSFSWLHRDPRILRQIYFLKDEYKISLAGFTPPPYTEMDFYKIFPAKLHFIHKLKMVFFCMLKLYEKAYWTNPRVKSGLNLFNNKKADLIIANDLNTLPLCSLLAKKWNSRLICDLHEYSPAEFDANPVWKRIIGPYNRYLCNKYIPLADKLITVCGTIAERYEKEWGKKCEVIDNATFYAKLKPIGVKENEIRMIHHGIAVPERQIENMIYLMSLLNKRYKLDLLLMPYNTRYIKKLKRMVEKDNRIKIIDPIPAKDIVYYLNRYDIGLFLLSPEHFNYFVALPNKLFEFIQARLCVAIWPSIEMKKIVEKYQCGIVTNSFSLKEMAKRLNSISPQEIYRYKVNSETAAKELCAENNKDRFLKIIKELI